jgi:hypothetical protein
MDLLKGLIKEMITKMLTIGRAEYKTRRKGNCSGDDGALSLSHIGLDVLTQVLLRVLSQKHDKRSNPT